MYRAKFIFGVTLISFSAHLGAIQAYTPIEEESLCHCLTSSSDHKINHMVARENYEEALRQSFDENWLEADEASARAGWLDHGARTWAFDAKNLLE